jgi:hypothetical protein
MDTMKNPPGLRKAFSTCLILLLCCPCLFARDAGRAAMEARVNGGLVVLLVLGFLYGSWRLMGMGRKE